MTGTWQTISTILETGPRSKGPLGDLLDYIRGKLGEHEADELQDYIRTASDPAHVRKHVALKYMDGKADKLAAALTSAPSGKDEPGHRGPGRPPKSQAHVGNWTSDKGSGPSEPIPSRPGRSPDAGSKLMSPSPNRGEHDVGTAGMHRKSQSYSMAPGAEMTKGMGFVWMEKAGSKSRG